MEGFCQEGAYHIFSSFAREKNRIRHEPAGRRGRRLHVKKPHKEKQTLVRSGILRYNKIATYGFEDGMGIPGMPERCMPREGK